MFRIWFYSNDDTVILFIVFPYFKAMNPDCSENRVQVSFLIN